MVGGCRVTSDTEGKKESPGTVHSNKKGLKWGASTLGSHEISNIFSKQRHHAGQSYGGVPKKGKKSGHAAGERDNLGPTQGP